jgi:hypothetical protein
MAAMQAEAEAAYQAQLQQDINQVVQEMEEKHKQEVRQLQSVIAQKDKTIGELEQKIMILQIKNMLHQQAINIDRLNQYVQSNQDQTNHRANHNL